MLRFTSLGEGITDGAGFRRTYVMEHEVGIYLGLDEIGSTSSIIIFIIISYLFNHTF